jgi:aminomethyltransferase
VKFFGADRLDFLETVYTTDFAALKPGESKLSLILTEKGGIIDDSIMSSFGNHHHAVINAGNTDIDLAHFDRILAEKFQGKDVRYEVLKDRALVALQGPASMSVLQKFLKEDLTKMPFMSIIDTKLQGLNVNAIICRCGYTGILFFDFFLYLGEDGFEISVAPDDAENLCDALFSDSKVIPAGLGARDSLRLEAGLCLHGNDMSAEVTPIEALLMWTVRKQNIKLPHLGQDALEKLKDVRFK